MKFKVYHEWDKMQLKSRGFCEKVLKECEQNINPCKILTRIYPLSAFTKPFSANKQLPTFLKRLFLPFN